MAAVSVISLGEIRFGLRLNPVPPHIRERIEAMLHVVQTRPLGPAVADQYADALTHLQRKGTSIGPNDLWLAAHALAEDLMLVTNNEREFKRVPKLRVENWLRLRSRGHPDHLSDRTFEQVRVSQEVSADAAATRNPLSHMD